MSENVIPSSPEDLNKIKNAIVEASDSMTRIAAEKDLIKDIRQEMKEKFKLEPKHFNKMLKTYHKQNFGEVTSENSNFEHMYEKVIGSVSNTDNTFDRFDEEN